MAKDLAKRRRIAKMVDAGMSVREIAAALQLSTQRIYQLLQDTGEEQATG